MGKILRKTGFAFAVPLCLAFTVACTDYSSDINDLHGRLDEIESSRIASIDGQLKAINATIPQLEKTDADLKEMIENLQKTADGLGKSISDNGESISDLKTDLEKAVENLRNSDKSDKEYVLDSLAKAKAVLLALLESEKAELEGKLVLVNNAVADLRKKDAELEKSISDLKIYADKELKESKDWIAATFMTLEQYNSIVGQLGGIKGEMSGLGTSMSNLESRLSEKYSEALKTAVEEVKSVLGEDVDGLNDRIDKEVSGITKAYTAAITTFREEMENWWSESLKKSIDDSETSMKSWVNGTLDGYWTIAQTKDSLKALSDDIENQLKAQKTFLNGLVEDNAADIKTLNDKLKELDEAVKKNSEDADAVGKALEEAKNDLTKAYTDAISKAISEFEGVFSEEIKSRIASANNSLDAKNKTMESKVWLLETYVNNLENKLSQLLNATRAYSIQSVSWLPTSKDGKETLYYDKGDPEFPGSDNYRYITFRFAVSPSSEAANITKSLLSARLLYTKTRAAAGEDVKLDITDFSNSFGVITVTIDASKVSKDFIDGKIPASVAVAVGDRSTEYVPLKAQALENPVIRYATTDGKMLPDSEIAGVRGFSKVGGILNRKHIYGRIDFTGAEIGKLLLDLRRSTWEGSTLQKIKICRPVEAMNKYPDKNSDSERTVLFKNQWNLRVADLENLDVSQVIDFDEMFYQCCMLRDLRISSWNPKPQRMVSTFELCYNLKVVDLSGWDVSEFNNRIDRMFYNCMGLIDVYWDNWNLAKFDPYKNPRMMDNVFSGIRSDRHDLNIYVRYCNKVTVDAVKRMVDNSHVHMGEPTKANIITK